MRQNEESRLQKSCVTWFRLQYPQYLNLLFAVPNGSRRDAVTAAILKSEGVRAGVSDLILLMPSGDFHSLCIEMKTAKGRQSSEQINWQKSVEASGNRYVVCRSVDEFMKAVNNYLA